jgi:hypothetical protein
MASFLIYLLILNVGILIGYGMRVWLVHRFTDYTGTIRVSKESEKTVYSLILDDYPEKLEFKKEVVFKVDASDVEPDRK